MSRSAYLAQLAERELGVAKGPGASPSAHAAIKRLQELFARNPTGDAAADIRGERDAR